MLTLTEELAQKALLLPPEERIRLAEGLLATVQEVDAEAEAAWDAEIKRRLAEIDQGTAHLIPAVDVFSEIRRLIQP
jgi:putative addiction module component (TIGR02574 family)